MRYFGYGSNLDAEDLRRWVEERSLDVSGMRLITEAHLPDHALAFHYVSTSRGGGALDVVPARLCAVPGALYELDAAAERALDAKEGRPELYERREVICLDPAGREVAATTYVVTDARVEDHHVPPSPSYLAIVRRGLARLGLSAAPLETAATTPLQSPWPASVFVYGTLRSGQSRAHMLTGRRTPAAVAGALLDLGPYPGLVLERSDRPIVGEHVEVTAAELEALDDVEDFLGYGAQGSLYRRVPVALEDGRWAWTYLWLGAPHPAIEGGDWVAHHERRASDLV